MLLLNVTIGCVYGLNEKKISVAPMFLKEKKETFNKSLVFELLKLILL